MFFARNEGGSSGTKQTCSRWELRTVFCSCRKYHLCSFSRKKQCRNLWGVGGLFASQMRVGLRRGGGCLLRKCAWCDSFCCLLRKCAGKCAANALRCLRGWAVCFANALTNALRCFLCKNIFGVGYSFIFLWVFTFNLFL